MMLPPVKIHFSVGLSVGESFLSQTKAFKRQWKFIGSQMIALAWGPDSKFWIIALGQGETLPWRQRWQ